MIKLKFIVYIAALWLDYINVVITIKFITC